MSRNGVGLKLWSVCLLVTATFLWGCEGVGSLQRLESAEPPMESVDLRGKWVTVDTNNQQPEYFMVDHGTADIYFVSYLNPNGKLSENYEVSLVRVGKYTFLDAYFSEIESGEEHRDADDLRVLPIHFIGRVWFEGDTLRLGLLNREWLQGMISSGKVDLPYFKHREENESLLLLTAESDKLADFVRRYAEDPDAFSTMLTFHRVGPFERRPSDSVH